MEVLWRKKLPARRQQRLLQRFFETAELVKLVRLRQEVPFLKEKKGRNNLFGVDLSSAPLPKKEFYGYH